jgi:hypothetical protein
MIWAWLQYNSKSLDKHKKFDQLLFLLKGDATQSFEHFQDLSFDIFFYSFTILQFTVLPTSGSVLFLSQFNLVFAKSLTEKNILGIFERWLQEWLSTGRFHKEVYLCNLPQAKLYCTQ